MGATDPRCLLAPDLTLQHRTTLRQNGRCAARARQERAARTVRWCSMRSIHSSQSSSDSHRIASGKCHNTARTDESHTALATQLNALLRSLAKCCRPTALSVSTAFSAEMIGASRGWKQRKGESKQVGRTSSAVEVSISSC
eukprot:191241-Rhodomonas_salina.1